VTNGLKTVVFCAACLAFCRHPYRLRSHADEPDLIFRPRPSSQAAQPNDKLATYGVDRPEVGKGVAAIFRFRKRAAIRLARARRAGVGHSLACRQIGPIRFKDKHDPGDETMFRSAARLFFKRMRSARLPACRGASSLKRSSGGRSNLVHRRRTQPYGWRQKPGKQHKNDGLTVCQRP